MDRCRLLSQSFRFGKGFVVKRLFDNIAYKYDLANVVISLGFSEVWRKKAVNFCKVKGKERMVLDLCSGTGTLSFEVLKSLGPYSVVVGVDFSQNMTRIAVERSRTKRLDDRALFIEGDVLSLPLRDNIFDCVLTAFCLRNVESLEDMFREAYRVLKPGGVFVALDLSMPSNTVVRKVYEKYLRFFVGPVGDTISGRPHYYHYIAESLQNYPDKRELGKTIARAGFSRVRYYEFNLGAVSIHVGEKAMPRADREQ
ncbi:MAG: bifunctional demethylmenaquinone methyltransferase/2-methoxy-6-polyprenyl-1,4-benzoquinol methylase UbiE [Acidilobaceae archaeon]